MKKFLVLTVAVALVLLAAPRLQATELNLESLGASGYINGAYFQQGSTGSGTGIFPSFVRIQANGTEQGYNTTVNDIYNNTSDDTHNYAIQLQNLTTIDQGGVTYYEFLLDINEAGGGNEVLSLDRILVGVSTTPNNTAAITATGTGANQFNWLYDLDNGDPTNSILLDYSLATGSGTSDMRFLVPVTLFTGQSPAAYVYLYSAFGSKGGLYDSSDGFEEWSYRTGPGFQAPDGGATALLLGLSMLGMGVVRRFRR